MKILYISPVGVGTYSRDMAHIMDSARRPETSIDVVSFPADRPTHLEYHSYEGLVLPDIIKQVYAASTKYDCIIIGGYYDVGLRGAREVSGRAVVVAPCEATTAIASSLGNAFSVVVGKHKWIAKMSQNVRNYGHRDHMVSMRATALAVHDFQTHPDAAERLLAVGRQCVEEDGAEVLILGCTVEYGFSKEMQEALGVPVIEAIPAALKYAEMLTDAAQRFGWHPSRKWGSEAPPPEEIEAPVQGAAADWGCYRDQRNRRPRACRIEWLSATTADGETACAVSGRPPRLPLNVWSGSVRVALSATNRRPPLPCAVLLKKGVNE